MGTYKFLYNTTVNHFSIHFPALKSNFVSILFNKTSYRSFQANDIGSFSETTKKVATFQKHAYFFPSAVKKHTSVP
jgi:hypothetical protein